LAHSKTLCGLLLSSSEKQKYSHGIQLKNFQLQVIENLTYAHLSKKGLYFSHVKKTQSPKS
jgi:hypothetical protein